MLIELIVGALGFTYLGLNFYEGRRKEKEICSVLMAAPAIIDKISGIDETQKNLKLKDEEINSLKCQIDVLADKIKKDEEIHECYRKDHNDKIEENVREIKKLNKEICNWETKYNRIEKQNEEYEYEIEDLEKKYYGNDPNNKIKQNEKEIKKLNRELSFLRTDYNDKETECNEFLKICNETKKENNKLIESLIEEQIKNDKLKIKNKNNI